jgi:hypothetical protein
MTAIRQLEPWEQSALRAHDAGNHDAKAVGDEVGRKAKTVRRLWEDATAWETWAIFRRLNGEPEPVWRAQKNAPVQETGGGEGGGVEVVAAARAASRARHAPAHTRARAHDLLPSQAEVVDDGARWGRFMAELEAHGEIVIAMEAAGILRDELLASLADGETLREVSQARAAPVSSLLRTLIDAAQSGDRDLAQSTRAALMAIRPDRFDRRTAGEDGDPLSGIIGEGDEVETPAARLLADMAARGGLEAAASCDLMDLEALPEGARR